MSEHTPIPTDNAADALRFCRQLAASVSAMHTPPSKKELSVVVPVYNEENTLPELYQRLTTALEDIGESFEILFVNDGSFDQSVTMIQEIIQKDARVRMVNLSRNFGHQVAVSAGLDYADGNGVIVMDGDLQDPPELLSDFVKEWREGADVVYAIRETRQEGRLKVTAYETFYRLLNWISHIEIPLDAGDFCLMDRRVVSLMCSMPERSRFLRGIRSWVGFTQKGISYHRDARHAGHSKYTVSKLFRLAFDGVLSFSNVPLRIATVSGFVISGSSFVLGLYFLVRRLTVGEAPAGFATLITSIMFFSGVILLTLGVIGEYVGRIFDEVKQRPLYVVRDVVEHPSS